MGTKTTTETASGPEQIDPRAVMVLLEGDPADDTARLADWLVDAGAGSDLPHALEAVRHARLASAALRSGRTDELVRETRRALDVVPASCAPLLFLVGSLLQACFRFTADAELRRLALDVLGRVADRVDAPHLAVPARGLMANIHMMRGDLHRASAMAEAAVALADATGIGDALPVAMAWQFRAYVLFEWNRLDEAEEALHRAWALGDGSKGVRSGVARVMARVRAARGDQEGAEGWLARLEALVAEPLTLRNREWLAAVRAGHALAPAALKEVEGWLRAQGYAPAEAVALEALGRPGEADASLLRALTLGKDGGFVRAFLEGSPMRGRLLRRAASGGPEAAQAERILGTVEGGTGVGAPLTPTQGEVLRHVATGASNKAIAHAMGISVTTVKTHLRAVFQRLEVSSRTQAVARGRELGVV